MKKFVLKNSKGEYFTMSAAGMTTTASFKEALQYTEGTGTLLARSFNARYRDDMALVLADTEALTYYTKCAYHAFDQGDAKRTAERIRKGKYREYDDGRPVCIDGLWFVYAHPAERAEA